MSFPSVCIKVRALNEQSDSSHEKDFMDLHGNSLLLPTTEPLRYLCSRHFAKFAINSTVVVPVLDSNNVVDRVGARNICVPVVWKTANDRVCASKSCCFFYEVLIGRMIGVSKCNVVFDLCGLS